MSELDKSHGNLKSEINNFFNLDEVNFSAIGNRGGGNKEESEIFDIQTLSREMTTSIA